MTAATQPGSLSVLLEGANAVPASITGVRVPQMVYSTSTAALPSYFSSTEYSNSVPVVSR